MLRHARILGDGEFDEGIEIFNGLQVYQLLDLYTGTDEQMLCVSEQDAIVKV